MALGMHEQPLGDEMVRALVDRLLDQEGEAPDEVAKLITVWREFDTAARNALDAFEPGGYPNAT
jgi:hypothetical protein